jgi:glycosyltransferase involved in cell wall biosynthesis
MKIALVYDAVYPYIKGGGEKRFYEIGKRLSNKHEIHFYGQKLWEGKKVIKNEGMFYHGIAKPFSLYTKEKRRSIKEAISFGISSLKLIKEDIDIIDCCGFPYFSLFSCKLVSLVRGIPLYSTWHEVWGKEYWNHYLGKLGIIGSLVERLASKLPDKIISVSDLTTKRLIEDLKVPKDKVITIPNSIDIGVINKVKPSKEKSDIIFAGRLLSHKNVDLLIRSISLLVKQHPKIRCIICGDGPEKDKLIQLSNSLRLSKNIIFKGFIKSESEVYSLMKSSKCFVLPSEREGFGIVVIEANACGIPVVTVNAKDNASQFLIKEGKNGFVGDLNPKSLASTINNALKKGKSMKQTSIKEAKRYTLDNMYSKLKEVYK